MDCEPSPWFWGEKGATIVASWESLTLRFQKKVEFPECRLPLTVTPDWRTSELVHATKPRHR